MKLIIGLGNPGEKYQYTRHNIGFLFLSYIQEKENFSEFKNEQKFKGEISTGILGGEKVILLKPQTFMNLSGESISKICSFYKIKEKDWIVVYDDKDMEFGKLRFRDKGSAGGHNGIKNMIQYFGLGFNRIKVGIGKNDNYETADWVLSKFTQTELNDLEDNIFPKIDILLQEKIK